MLKHEADNDVLEFGKCATVMTGVDSLNGTMKLDLQLFFSSGPFLLRNMYGAVVVP